MKNSSKKERSTESLTIRIKPSIKDKLKKLSEKNQVGMAEQIENFILTTYEKRF